ncbi:putative RNA methyltransferase [Bhargavaea ginsengi]|uniref:putative RNA methyltransferase n=1 Tax=Bhargavaea ginsengi TaxID=426757 RepID=UPI003C724D92
MSKRIDGAMRAARIAHALKCPVCGNPVQVEEGGRLLCPENHSFDFAKQGYVNVLTRPAAGHYNKELFEARRRIMLESGLYAPFHKAAADLVREVPLPASEPGIIADIGCGEGTHLHKILEELDDPDITGAGLDIAKEGVQLAARDFQDAVWLVGDLAQSPFADGSIHTILNILSPSNYEEFARMLAPGGRLIKAVPGAGYLRELREALYTDERRTYSNEGTVELFDRHFRRTETVPLRYSVLLGRAQLEDLVRMTPLSWSPDPEAVSRFLDRESAEITVELDLLIGEPRD